MITQQQHRRDGQNERRHGQRQMISAHVPREVADTHRELQRV